MPGGENLAVYHFGLDCSKLDRENVAINSIGYSSHSEWSPNKRYVGYQDDNSYTF